MSHSDPILGLDLGTSTCLACAIVDGAPRFVRPDLYYWKPERHDLDYPGEIMPSAFCDRDGEALVGHRALNELYDPRYAPNVRQGVKRLLSRDGEVLIRLGKRNYAPSEITGKYVQVLVGAAARELNVPPSRLKRAVVTVPANFGARAQAATLRACALGGLNPDGVHLVDEPVAAAYSLGLHLQPGRQRVLVVDLGGGTFDVALWDVGRDAGPFGFVELGRDGDSLLGGLEWDREIADWVVRELRPRLAAPLYDRLIAGVRDYGLPELTSPVCEYGVTSLFPACERAKMELSLKLKTSGMADPSTPLDPRRLENLHVYFLPSIEAGERELSADMPAALFLRRTERLLNQCVLVCERLFHDVRTIHKLPDFGWRDLDAIFLAGGGSRLPTLQRLFAERAGRKPVLDDNPQHAVVKGAAMLGDLWRDGHELPGLVGRSRYMRSIGIWHPSSRPGGNYRFDPLVPRNQELPHETVKKFRTVGDPQFRALLMQFAEQEFHHDGPRVEEIAALRIDDLPPSAGTGEEAIRVAVRCGLDERPSFEVEFRGRKVEVDLNALEQRNGAVNGRHDSDAPRHDRD